MDEWQAKVDEHGREIGRHSTALGRISESLDHLQRETHEIRITLRERDETTKFLKSIFSGILVAVVLQLAGTVWWAAQLDVAVKTLTATVSDHEARLRTSEKHPN